LRLQDLGLGITGSDDAVVGFNIPLETLQVISDLLEAWSSDMGISLDRGFSTALYKNASACCRGSSSGDRSSTTAVTYYVQ